MFCTAKGRLKKIICHSKILRVCIFRAYLYSRITAVGTPAEEAPVVAAAAVVVVVGLRKLRHQHRVRDDFARAGALVADDPLVRLLIGQLEQRFRLRQVALHRGGSPARAETRYS